jgi:dTDP-4-amino-4,6-dideoxygalactose transaminase
MNIPPLKLTEQHAPIRDRMAERLLAVLDSGGYILGKEGAELERRLAEYCGAKHARALNSGTDALIIGLAALGVGCGDEVVVPAFTFIATAEAARWLGARPVFVDIEPLGFNMDQRKLEAVVTSSTKVVMPVHLFGQAADMDEINELTDPLGVSVLEDMAQAIGAEYKGRKVGSLSAAAALSFYPTKNLGACGDGGMILLNRDRLLKPVELLRNHGMHERYYHLVDGLNSRLDEFQAAVLNVKLDHLDEWNGLRGQAAAYYDELLADVDGVVTPQVLPDRNHVYHCYTIRVLSDGWVEPGYVGGPAEGELHHGPHSGPNGCASEAHRGTMAVARHNDADNHPLPPVPGERPSAHAVPSPARRDQVHDHLRASGVVSMIYYPVPLHLQTVYAQYGLKPGLFPVAERAASEVISLPVFPGITRDEQQYVVSKLREGLAL